MNDGLVPKSSCFCPLCAYLESIHPCLRSLNGCLDLTNLCLHSLDGCLDSMNLCLHSLNPCLHSLDGCLQSSNGCFGSTKQCLPSLHASCEPLAVASAKFRQPTNSLLKLPQLDFIGRYTLSISRKCKQKIMVVWAEHKPGKSAGIQSWNKRIA